MGGYSGSTEDKKIYDLTDVVEDAGSSNKLNEEIIKRATRKNPRQGLKVDTNRHGIRRETNLMPKPPKKKKYK